MAEFPSQIICKQESSLNEEINQEWQNTLYANVTEKKCGEIILLSNNKFWFLCTFCDERFHSIIIFQNHIKGIHITDDGNFPLNLDGNPLDLHPNEKLELEEDENYNDRVNDNFWNDNLALKTNCKKIGKYDLNYSEETRNEKNKIQELFLSSEFDSTGEIVSKNTESNNVDAIQLSVSENENVQRTTALICKDIEDLIPAPENVPKKRKRRTKVYTCPICQHIARDKLSLEAHKQSNHGTGTQYQCEECGKCFRNGSNLRSHLVIHAGTRPHKCDMCDAGFSHYNSLKTHRFTHTGERPHKCQQCDKGFVSSSGLKTHLREHTGEIPYVCHFCEKGFNTQCSYKRHMISHSGRRAHECTQCDKAFIHKETLTKHMACHSNEKKFVCDICPKKFNHKKNLIQHQKLHLDIKQYICKICNKDFAQYAGLYCHMKYHTNKD